MAQFMPVETALKRNRTVTREVNGTFEKVGYTEDSSVLLWINHEYVDYPIHWHSAVEIIMPLENIYSVSMNKTNFTLREGDIIIIPPGELHELFAPQTGKRLIILFDFNMISKLKGFSGILPIMTQPRLITAENSPEIYNEEHDLLTEIAKEYSSDNSYWEASIYAYFIRFFINVGRSHLDSSTLLPYTRANKQKEYIEKFNMIFDYIDQNYMEDVSLEDVAATAGFSKFHFSRLFKQFTDTSFYDYLSLRRIKSAEGLLLDPGLPITEVALQSGFSSISTFNRVFKNFKKCTPTEYKEFYRAKNRESYDDFK